MSYSITVLQQGKLIRPKRLLRKAKHRTILVNFNFEKHRNNFPGTLAHTERKLRHEISRVMGDFPTQMTPTKCARAAKGEQATG